MLLLQLSTGCALVFSVLALIISTRNVALPRRKLTQIDLTLGDIDHDIQSIRSSVRRINARVGMRDARAKKGDKASGSDEAGEQTNGTDGEYSQLPGETPQQWKERMRKGPLRRGIRPG